MVTAIDLEEDEKTYISNDILDLPPIKDIVMSNDEINAQLTLIRTPINIPKYNLINETEFSKYVISPSWVSADNIKKYNK